MRKKSGMLAAFTLAAALAAPGLAPSSAKADDSGQVIIPYLATGWKSLDVATGADAGFEAPGYDDSSWASSQAGFGTTDGTCSWNNPASVNTAWAPNTDILVRHHFTVPAGSGDLHLVGTVDNDADIYVNGIELGTVSSGFCAAGAIDIKVPAADLNASDNVLAIRGTDEGQATYLDVQLSAPAPAGPVYVAMGDSYSSGEGAPPFYPETLAPDPNNPSLGPSGGGCHRSEGGWPLGVAASQGLTGDQWKFVACSGAVLADFNGPNTQWPTENEPAQESWLNRQTTRLVTFTIGGNDVGFERILRDCVGDLPAYLTSGSVNCANKVADIIAKTIPPFQRALPGQIENIASNMAPGGLIVVGTYPRLFSTNILRYYSTRGEACVLGTTLGGAVAAGISYNSAQAIDKAADLGDQAITNAVNKAQRYLTANHSTVRVVVTKTVDSEFHGHRLCDGGTWYLNGVVFASETSTKHLRLSFHPNANGGQAAYGRAFRTAIAAAS